MLCNHNFGLDVNLFLLSLNVLIASAACRDQKSSMTSVNIEIGGLSNLLMYVLTLLFLPPARNEENIARCHVEEKGHKVANLSLSLFPYTTLTSFRLGLFSPNISEIS